VSYDLTISGTIAASAEEVFRARTDPELQRRLNAHPISRASVDLRVGGKARLEWGPSEDALCRVSQVYQQIDPPRRITYREVLEEPDAPIYESVITEIFDEWPGGTLLTFHHEGFPSAEERDKHRQGYHIILERLQKYFFYEGRPR